MPALLSSEAAAFLLAVARIAAFVSVSPFPGKNVPTQAKVGLVLALAFVARAATPAVGVPGPLALDLGLLGLVPGEVALGLVIGFTVRITVAAAEILGAAVAQSSGLTMGGVYDPTLGTDDPILARIVTLLALLLFVAIGAHRVALAYVLESFRVLPIGHPIDAAAALPSLVSFLERATDAGVRLSLPIVAVGLAIQAALALVARAAPSLQVFSIGMGITFGATLLVLLGTLDDSAAGIAAELGEVGPRIEQVAVDVAERSSAAETLLGGSGGLPPDVRDVGSPPR